jgi:5-methylcytosine-specific restriction endonuclease McrA
MVYAKSIICEDMTTCYLCGSSYYIEIHHVFSGFNRSKSTKYGLVVPLCRNCHRGDEGVHSNYSKMKYLRKIGQQKFEEKYPDLDFIKIFGRNYL